MNMMTPAVPVMSERRVTLMGALLIALGPVSMALYTPAMPEIVHAFGTTESAVKLTLSLYFAGFALAQLFCGPLSDGFGRRPVTIAFMVVYFAASMVALLSPSVEILIVARFIQGVGAAVGVSMSRAIVRDLFSNERSVRIMNMIGMILAVGPAFSPAIGGFTMQLFGWHAIFVLMALFGVGIILAAVFIMRETVTRDLSRIRPKAIARSYATLLASPYFMLSSLIMAGTLGALYAQATLLPFILINRVGLTPTQFGFGMLMQSGFYFLGSLSVRLTMRRLGLERLAPVGFVFIAMGALTLAILPRVMEPGFWIVMGPIGAFAFGIAYVIPTTLTASLSPFPHMAGAASSLSSFLQMGAGLAGSMIAVLIDDPMISIATVIPSMGLMALLSWSAWRRMPEPQQPVAVTPELPVQV